MKQTLGNLIEDAARLESMLIDSGGEISEELEAELKSWEENFEEKIDGYGVIMERFELSAEHWKRKASQMTQTARQLDNMVKRLKDRLRFGMTSLGRDEVTGDQYRFKLSKIAPKVVIEDESVIPSVCLEKEEKWKISKTKVKDMLLSGRHVPGAYLEDNYSLRRSINKEVISE